MVLAHDPTVGVRYYNAVTGRYINRDPLGYADGLNPYLYVHNNPINRIDPLGLWDWGWKALAVIGNVSSGIADAVTFGAVGAIQDHMGVSGSVDRTGIAYKVGTVAASVNPQGLVKGALREVARVVVNGVKSEVTGAVTGAVQGAVLEKADELTGHDVSGMVANSQVAKQVLGAVAGQKGQASSGIKPEPQKRGPKPQHEGAHNQKVDQIGAGGTPSGVKPGEKVVAGGGLEPEVVIPTPGGKKEGRRPDVIIENETTGAQRGVNVGKVDKDGKPIKREQEALDDLNNHGGIPTTFEPYKTLPPPPPVSSKE